MDAVNLSSRHRGDLATNYRSLMYPFWLRFQAGVLEDGRVNEERVEQGRRFAPSRFLRKIQDNTIPIYLPLVHGNDFDRHPYTLHSFVFEKTDATTLEGETGSAITAEGERALNSVGAARYHHIPKIVLKNVANNVLRADESLLNAVITLVHYNEIMNIPGTSVVPPVYNFEALSFFYDINDIDLRLIEGAPVDPYQLVRIPPDFNGNIPSIIDDRLDNKLILFRDLSKIIKDTRFAKLFINCSQLYNTTNPSRVVPSFPYSIRTIISTRHDRPEYTRDDFDTFPEHRVGTRLLTAQEMLDNHYREDDIRPPDPDFGVMFTGDNILGGENGRGLSSIIFAKYPISYIWEGTDHRPYRILNMNFHSTDLPENLVNHFDAHPNMDTVARIGPQYYFPGFHSLVPLTVRAQLERRSYSINKESALHFFYRYSSLRAGSVRPAGMPATYQLLINPSTRMGASYPYRATQESPASPIIYDTDDFFFTYYRTQVFGENDFGGPRGKFTDQIAKEFVYLFEPIVAGSRYFKLKPIATIVDRPDVDRASKEQNFMEFFNIMYRGAFHPYTLNKISGFGNLNFDPNVLRDATYRLLQISCSENDQMFFEYPILLNGDTMLTFYKRFLKSFFGRSVLAFLNFEKNYDPSTPAQKANLSRTVSPTSRYPPQFDDPYGTYDTQEGQLLLFSHKFQKQFMYLLAVYLFGAKNAAGRYIYFPNIVNENREATHRDYKKYMPAYNGTGQTKYPVLAFALDQFIYLHNNIMNLPDDFNNNTRSSLTMLVNKFTNREMPTTADYSSFADHIYSHIDEHYNINFARKNTNKQMYFQNDVNDTYRLYALPNFAIMNYMRNTLGPRREVPRTNAGPPVFAGVPSGIRMYPYDMMKAVNATNNDAFKVLSQMLSDGVVDENGFGNISRVDFLRPGHHDVPAPPYFDEDDGRPGLDTLKRMIKDKLVEKDRELRQAILVKNTARELSLMTEARTFAEIVTGSPIINPSLKGKITVHLIYDDVAPHTYTHACTRYVVLSIPMHERTGGVHNRYRYATNPGEHIYHGFNLSMLFDAGIAGETRV